MPSTSIFSSTDPKTIEVVVVSRHLSRTERTSLSVLVSLADVIAFGGLSVLG